MFFILYIIISGDKMRFVENECCELKSILTKDIKKAKKYEIIQKNFMLIY